MYETFKPGGRLHPTYFLEHKGHLVVEAVFLAVIAYLTLHPRAPHRSRKQETPLTEQARTQLLRGSAHRCSMHLLQCYLPSPGWRGGTYIPFICARMKWLHGNSNSS